MRELEIVALGAADGLVGPRPVPAGEAGEGVKHASAHTECLNCGAALHGRYCASCGQPDDDHHRSIFHLLWEAVEGLTHLDGRLARTLPPLFLSPGKLARDHFEGRRQRHVPPFRLFLITLLLFMFSLEAVMQGGRGSVEHPGQAAAPTIRDGVITAKDEKGRTTRVVIPTVAQVSRWSSGHVTDAEIARELQAKAATPAPADADADAGGAAPVVHAHVAFGRMDTSRGPVSLTVSNTTSTSDARETSTEKGLKAWLGDRISKAAAYPEYYKSLVFEWAHRLAILLLPIFAGQLALLYVYRRKFYVYDHLTVSMQFLSFVFLVSAIAWILPEPVRGWAVTAAAVWTPVNLFMLLRGAYGSGVIGALLKTLLLWCSTLSVFGVMLVGLLALGLQQL